MNRRALVGALVLAVSMAMLAAISLAAVPKTGKYAGKTSSGAKIAMTVKSKTKGTVKFCNYSMPTKIKGSGKFTAKHVGPGGTYLAVQGKFVTKTKATGKVTVDYLCGTLGDSFTLKRK